MSTSNEIKGTVAKILATQQINEKFRKRGLVIDVPDGKYNQVVLVEFANDKCSLVDDLREGDEVTVTVNIRGREWAPRGGGETKYFVSLDAWKVDREGAGQTVRPTTRGGTHDAPPPSAGAADDDLPFASADMNAEPSPIARVLR